MVILTLGPEAAGGVGIRMVLPKMDTVWVEAVFYLPMEWAVTIH